MQDSTSGNQLSSTKDYAVLFAKGFAMGSADVVPGVSGGTVAFIAGIYETLIDAISSINLRFIRLLATLHVREALAGFPWQFLLVLGAGIMTAILTMAHLLDWSLRHYPTHVWGFFFGLIVASIFIVMRRVRRWTPLNLAVLAVFTVAMFWLVGLAPHEMPHTPLFLFLSGALASCALILPGISGAFILVLVGQYHYVLEAVVEQNWLVLVLVAAGALVGLLLFARVLKWLFHHYHDLTVAALIGLMIGSLRKIWPWKMTLQSEVEPDGAVIPLVQANVLPDAFSAEVATVVGLAALAFALVAGLEYLANRSQALRLAQPVPQEAVDTVQR